jgi:hypothetical protein
MRWEDDPRRPLLLPAGQLFDVVSVEQRLGLEAFDQLNRHDLPSGPVMIDHKARRVGFFLSANSRYWFGYFIKREAKRPVDYRYLSSDSVVVVPGPMPLSGDRYEWLRAPIRRPEANPCRPIALATVLGASAELLARVCGETELLSVAVDAGQQFCRGPPYGR